MDNRKRESMKAGVNNVSWHYASYTNTMFTVAEKVVWHTALVLLYLIS